MATVRVPEVVPPPATVRDSEKLSKDGEWMRRESWVLVTEMPASAVRSERHISSFTMSPSWIVSILSCLEISGLGTDRIHSLVTTAIVTRADIAMMKIRGEYFNMYKTSVENAVIDNNTSGDYKNFIVTLVGGRF